MHGYTEDSLNNLNVCAVSYYSQQYIENIFWKAIGSSTDSLFGEVIEATFSWIQSDSLHEPSEM